MPIDSERPEKVILPPRDLEVLKRAADGGLTLVPGGDPWTVVSCVSLLSYGLVSIGPPSDARTVSITAAGQARLAGIELDDLLGAL